MYLLDTDHCVFLMRRVESVCQHFEEFAAQEASVSIITVGELLFGAYSSARLEENLAETNRLLDSLPVLDLTRPVMDRFAQIKVDLFRRGLKLEDPDILIAATVLEHDLVLVTHNIAHYERVSGLRIEDWYRQSRST